jgi:hypothetical protein
MSFRNPSADRQAQTDAGLLGGHKWLENPLTQARRQSAAVVTDHQGYPAGRFHAVHRRCLPWSPFRGRSRSPQVHRNGARRRDGVDGVQQQIQHDLPHLVQVGFDDQRPVRQMALYPNVLVTGAGGHEFHRLPYHAAQVHWLLVECRWAGEIEKRLHGPLQAIDRFLQDG